MGEAFWLGFLWDGGDGQRFIEMATLVATLGISPLVALAAMGLMAYAGHLQLPPALALLDEPALFVGLFALGLLLQFGKSSKLTRPLAETVGTGESLMAVAVAFLVFMAENQAVATVQTLGVGSFGLALSAACTVTAILLVRTLLDLMIWLSPVPLIDASFEAAKTGITVTLVVLTAWSPWLAFALYLTLLGVAVLTVRWGIRTTRVAWRSLAARFGTVPPRIQGA